MIQLTLTEASAIKEFLDDPAGKIAIRSFCDHHRTYYADKCKDEMILGNVKEAEKFAHYAQMYDAVLPSLRDFAERQMRQQ